MFKSLFACGVGAMLTCSVYTVLEGARAPQQPLPLEAFAAEAAIAPRLGQAPLTIKGGLYNVDVIINGSAPLAFALDSGDAMMNLPRSMLDKLIAEGKVSQADYNHPATSILADGREVIGSVYTLRSVTIAGRTLRNVLCTVGGDKDLPLLGQSVLAKFNSWAVDNQHRTLTIV
jgi:predicted aspartyl protease